MQPRGICILNYNDWTMLSTKSSKSVVKDYGNFPIKGEQRNWHQEEEKINHLRVKGQEEHEC